MPALEVGQTVPDFSAPATSEAPFTLSDHKGVSNIVVYFYPKDSTPGCTTEGQNFRDSYADFQSNDTIVVGVSMDSMKRHENFKAKQEFPFQLIADIDGAVCQLFDVYKLKKMYGKEYMGIVRSTFLIDKKGVLRQHWDKVKVKGHVDEVLDAVKALDG